MQHNILSVKALSILGKTILTSCLFPIVQSCDSNNTISTMQTEQLPQYNPPQEQDYSELLKATLTGQHPDPTLLEEAITLLAYLQWG